MIKAAIFDYNGTLFKDDDINAMCWHKTIMEINNNFENFDDFFKEYKGLKNSIILNEVAKRSNLNKIDIQYWTERKEESYRNTCVELKRNKLTMGAEELFDYLKSKNIKMWLCTASIKSNVDFYYKHLNLSRWFLMEHTVYDTGEYKNKKEMYEASFKNINREPKEIVVFEDSPLAIKAVGELGCKNVFEIINNREPSKQSVIKQSIRDFTELDYSLIEIE